MYPLITTISFPIPFISINPTKKFTLCKNYNSKMEIFNCPSVGEWLDNLHNSEYFSTVNNRPIHIYCHVNIYSVQWLSRLRLFVTPRITARQASLSITNSRSSPKHILLKVKKQTKKPKQVNTQSHKAKGKLSLY